jgi:hypothetical protein
MNRLKIGLILIALMVLGNVSAFACSAHCSGGSCDAAQGEAKPASN